MRNTLKFLKIGMGLVYSYGGHTNTVGPQPASEMAREKVTSFQRQYFSVSEVCRYFRHIHA